MRTLKKTLCLVLALVMVLGLCAFNVAAFTDDASITYDEAVGVMAAAGVLKGFEDGSFQPNSTLTRAQAATMITKMMGFDGVKGTTTFTDTQGHWAESYIAFCVNEGIVSGYGDGTFGPDDTLTGSQWAKMVICALGYNAAKEGIVGDTWEVAVAKRVKNLHLADNIDGFDGTKPITRETACELGFQGMQANTTIYSPGITINGVEIPGDYDHVPASGDSLLKQMGIYSTAVTRDAATPDAFQHPVDYVWFKDGVGGTTGHLDAKDAVVYTSSASAAHTFTVAANFTNGIDDAGFAAELNTALKITATAKLLSYTYAANTVYMNGDTQTNLELKKGDEVEVYVDSANPTTVTKIIVTRWTATIVDDVKTLTATEKAALTAAQADAASKAKIHGVAGGAFILDIDIPGFNYEKDDVIVVAQNAANTVILASKPAETVEGKVTKTNGTTYTVGGKAYTAAGITNNSGIATPTPNFADEYVLYLAPNGSYFGIVAKTESVDTSLVYVTLAYKEVTAGTYGGTVTKYYAQGVDMSGKEVKYEVYYDTTASKYTVSSKAIADGGTELTLKTLYNVSVNSTGKAVFTAIAATGNATTKAVAVTGLTAAKTVSGSAITGGKVYYAAAQTVLYVNGNGSELKVSTATGKVDVASSDIVYADKTDTTATNYTVKYIIVDGTQPTATTGSGLVFSLETADSTSQVPYTKADGTAGTAYVHSAWIDGVATDILMDGTDADDAIGAATGKLYTYSVDSVTGLYTLTEVTSTQLKVATAITNIYNTTVVTASSVIVDMDLADVTVVNAIDPITAAAKYAVAPATADELMVGDTIAVVYQTVNSVVTPLMIYVTDVAAARLA